MPIPVNIEKEPQENVWFYKYHDSYSYSTGSSSFITNNLTVSFLKSNLGEVFCRSSLVQAGTQHNETNKMFLKFTNLLSEQYKAISAFYKNISLGDILSITSGIISELISLSPDSFSLELTNEESIFYTLKKGDYSFYIQQYFETEDDGFNATLVCYNGDNKMDSLNGNISNLLFSMEQKIYNTIPHNLNLTLLNEISY